MAFDLFGGGGFNLLGQQRGVGSWGVPRMYPPNNLTPQQLQALIQQIQEAELSRPSEGKSKRGFIGGLIPDILTQALGEIADVAIATPHAMFDIARHMSPAYVLGSGIRHLAQGNEQAALRDATFMPEVLKQTGVGTYEDFRHPLRHPGYTILSALSVAGPIGSAASRGTAAARAAAAFRTPKPTPLLEPGAPIPRAPRLGPSAEMMQPGFQATLFRQPGEAPHLEYARQIRDRTFTPSEQPIELPVRQIPGQTELGQELFNTRGVPKIADIARTYGLPLTSPEDLAVVKQVRDQLLQSPAAQEMFRPQLTPKALLAQQVMASIRERSPMQRADFEVGPTGEVTPLRVPGEPFERPRINYEPIPERLQEMPGQESLFDAPRTRPYEAEPTPLAPETVGPNQLELLTQRLTPERPTVTRQFGVSSVSQPRLRSTVEAQQEAFLRQQVETQQFREGRPARVQAERGRAGGPPSMEPVGREFVPPAPMKKGTPGLVTSGIELEATIKLLGKKAHDIKADKGLARQRARLVEEKGQTLVRAGHLSRKSHVLTEKANAFEKAMEAAQRRRKPIPQADWDRAKARLAALRDEIAQTNAELAQARDDIARLRRLQSGIRPYAVTAEGKQVGKQKFATVPTTLRKIKNLEDREAGRKKSRLAALVEAEERARAPFEFNRVGERVIPGTLEADAGWQRQLASEWDRQDVAAGRAPESPVVPEAPVEPSGGRPWWTVEGDMPEGPTTVRVRARSAEEAATLASGGFYANVRNPRAIAREPELSQSTAKRAEAPERAPEEVRTPEEAADVIRNDLEERIQADPVKPAGKRGAAPKSPKQGTPQRLAADLQWARTHGDAETAAVLEEALQLVKQAEMEKTAGRTVVEGEQPPAVRRGQSPLLAEGLGARELGVNPRALEQLGLDKTQAKEMSRRLHGKIVAVFKKAHEEGGEPTNREIYQVLVGEVGEDLAKKIAQRALSTRGAAPGLFRQAVKAAGAAAVAPRPVRFRDIEFAKHRDSGRILPRAFAEEQFAEQATKSVGKRGHLSQQGWELGRVRAELSRSPWVAPLQNMRISLLERFPEHRFARRGFEKKVRFEIAETKRLADAVKASVAAELPDEKTWAKLTEEERAKAFGKFMDSTNQLAKIGVLFLKPAYIPANMMGQLFLSLVDHSWNPVDLVKTVQLQRELYGSGMLSGRDAATIKAAMYETGLRESSYFERYGLPGVNQAYVKMADFYGKILDTPFRDAAFFKEARRWGYDSPEKIQRLVRGAQQGDVHLHDEFISIARRANRNIIDYSRLSKFEKNVVRRIIFFYPWFKAASIYGGRFAAEHPVQLGVLTQASKKAIEENKRDLPFLPSYLSGAFKVGEREIPGIGKVPRIVNPTSATVLGTPGEVVRAALTGVTGVGPGESLADYLTPFATAGIGGITKVDPFTGKSYPAGVGIPDIFLRTIKDTIAPLRLKAQLDRAEEIGQDPDAARRVLLPMNKREAIERFATGVSPYALNPREARERAFGERTAALSKRDKEIAKSAEMRSQWTEEFKRVGMDDNGGLPAQLKEAFMLQAQRNAELGAMEEERGRLKAIDRLEGDLRVLVRRGVIAEDSAKNLLIQMASAPDASITNVRRRLSGYFGGSVISAYRKAALLQGAELSGS